MGCIQSSSQAAVSPGHKIKTVQQAAPKALSEIKASGELYERVKQIAAFKCEITGLLTLHNYICLAREKKDVHNLLIFEVITQPANQIDNAISPSEVQIQNYMSVSQAESSGQLLGIYRSRQLELSKVTQSQQSIEEFKKLIYFKYVFLIGSSEGDMLDSQCMFKLLNCLITEQMKPFAVFLLPKIGSKQHIIDKGYGHLCMSGKLPLFPNIMLKATDLDKKDKSSRMRILLCESSQKVKKTQLEALNVKQIVLIDESASPDTSEFSGISMTQIKIQHFQTLCKAGAYDKAFQDLSQKVLPYLKSNKNSLCLVVQDADNIGVLLIAEFMMSKNKLLSRERALEILKARRPTANPLRQLVECLSNHTQQLFTHPSNQNGTKIQDEMPRKELITQCFRALKKGNAEPSFDLLDKLLKKIIDSQPESEQNLKFRTIKSQKKKLRQLVTNHKPGARLMLLIGFSLNKNEQGEEVWQNSASVSYLKGIRLDLQAGFSSR